MSLDRTASLLLDGYLFGERLRRRSGTDVARTRLLGRPAVVVVGRDAARLLYEGDRFERAGALPMRIQRTLTGTDAIQTLDDGAHAARRAFYLSVMTPERVEAFGELLADGWRAALDRWHPERVVVFDEAREVCFRAACTWTGTPVREHDVPVTAAALAALVNGFATVGPRHWLARTSRRRLEGWAADVIRDVRAGDAIVDAASPVAMLAQHRDDDGELLDEHVAAVELLNLLRPITAIAWYATFVVHALHAYPMWRERLRSSGDQEVDAFVQEVRRRYPFTPFVGARVRRSFAWRGETFEVGTLVLLDVVGTDHDPARWHDPGAFRPERFLGREPDPHGFIPQGGGDARGHRCAGERLTIAGMAATAAFFARQVRFSVPAQDLRIPMGRIPTRPRSGMVLTGVEAVGATSAPDVRDEVLRAS